MILDRSKFTDGETEGVGQVHVAPVVSRADLRAMTPSSEVRR